jgi:beta-aspartyl-peptidase (threonine type)
MRPVLVVHGGSGTVSPEHHEAAVLGTRAAARAGQAILLAGGSCEDAAVAAVRVLEDDPAFNAGRGACMNRDGRFEHDAALMRSRDLRSGAVAGVREVRDPILLARLVLEQTRHCLVVGDGAEALGRAHGVGRFGRDEVWTAKAEAAHRAVREGRAGADNRADTVGAVALDLEGNLCAAGSTGGILYKLPGRVGDTPLLGSGFYAHPELGACCTTGVGEALMTHVLALTALQRAGDPTAVQRLCVDISRRWDGAAIGLILVRPDGATILAHASEHMSWARAVGDAPISGGLAHPADAHP